MNIRPTPETDKFFATFADGEAAPSHAEYYARLQDLERERDEARFDLDFRRRLGDWQNKTIDDLTKQRDEAREELSEWRILNGWGGTPEIIHDFIKGQQTRIHHAQDLEAELATVTEQRDEIDSMYHKIIKEVLECDPIPACKRENDHLEPPWEVFARIREQRDMLAKALEKVSRSWNYVEVAREALQSLTPND
jgi:hypothetical protein